MVRNTRHDQDEFVHPAPGWLWCPACNGEGFCVMMQTNPDCTEYEYPCECDEGLVPDFHYQDWSKACDCGCSDFHYRMADDRKASLLELQLMREANSEGAD